MEDQRSSSISLTTEVQYLRGVGPRRAELFAQIGIHAARDLLHYYPRDYQFLPELCLINELTPNMNATIAGQIDTMRWVARARPPRLEARLSDSTGVIRLVWFHGRYLRDRLAPGDRLAAWGQVSRYRETIQIVNPQWMLVPDAESIPAGGDEGRAVYPATADITSRQIGAVVRQSLDALLANVEEWYDEAFRQKRRLPSRADALRWIHVPPDQDHIAEARRRLAYDELFLMELGIALRRERLRRNEQAAPLPVDKRLDARIRRLFPFTLTAAQERVIAEIRADLGRPSPMNRLLQGDVGSGKTVVALYAALAAVGNRRQVAIMAPTEILAEQHFLGIERYLRHSRVKRLLLTGGLTGKRRAQMLEQIRQGEIDLVVGTQALLQEDVGFARLGLVVVDEQHKFGVWQRQRIRGKNVAPHYLVMTATPIPRTLAMTVFGDLEVSIIDELPPGRVPIETRHVRPEQQQQAYQFIRTQLRRGRQAYIVCPRLQPEDDDAPEPEDLLDGYDVAAGPADAGRPQLKAAIAEHQRLRDEVFTDFRVGLVHGQMSRDEKQAVMQAFRAGEIDVLVATVVIEVGVDVPNATVMVIEHADYFGLAQLHQLRGRIGRGEHKSYCLLFGQARNETAARRLEVMTATNDGFRIAEEDLRIRGPGQFFGAAQHGLPELRLADLLRDGDLLRMARRDAFALAQEDPRLADPQNAVLKRHLLAAFGEGLRLVDVG